MRIIVAVGVGLTSLRGASAEPAETERAITHDAAEAVESGDMLPGLVGARHERREIQAQVFAGRDTTTGATTFASSLEATLVDRIAIRASFANDGYDPRIRPTAGLTIDAVRGPAFDLAIGAAYATQSYNQVPALVLHAALARRLAGTSLVANIEYGAGLSQGERYGAVGLGAIRVIAPHWYAGVASQAHLDLERDDDEPADERDWDVQAGPVASYSYGPFVVSASAGAAAWQFRLHPDRHFGAVGLLGAGAVF